jgi:hypothetical protein
MGKVSLGEKWQCFLNIPVMYSPAIHCRETYKKNPTNYYFVPQLIFLITVLKIKVLLNLRAELTYFN